jgi:tRNA threonylcarbamoyladenosine biosynthesis protein TsaB
LRIGIATARGLAQSLGVELAGVSSLRALAHEVNHRATDKDGEAHPGTGVDGSPWPDGALGAEGAIGTLTVIDARRGEVFAAAYDGDSELITPRALAPGAVGELLEGVAMRTSLRLWIAVGDGALRYRDTLARPGVLVPDARSALHRIQGRAICRLGELAHVGEAQVVPDYRRRPDAEIALEGAIS